MRRILAFCMVFLFVCVFIQPTTTAAAGAGKQVNISIMHNRPLSIDRFLHTAFQDVGYNAIFSDDTPQIGYSMANDAERDGVVSFNPGMEQDFPNLRRVPIALDRNRIVAFTRAEAGFEVSRWSDITDKSVGTLVQRVYIENRIMAYTDKLVKKESVNRVMDSLISGECDVIILSYLEHENISLPDGIVLAGIIEIMPEYLYMHKSYEYLIPNLSDAIRTLFIDGRGEKIINDIPIPEMYPKKTILHIISSNEQLRREEDFSQELKSHFDLDRGLEWYTFSLNSKRFSDDPSRLAYFANLLRRDSVARNIGAIIVSGNAALGFLNEYYHLLFRNTPVLFYGVDGHDLPLAIGYEEYFAGIIDELAAYETLEAALELFPKTKKVYVLNDYTQEGLIYRRVMEEQLQPFIGRVELNYSEDVDFDTLLVELRDLPEDSLVLVGSYFCDSNGQYFSQSEIKRAMEANCTAPIFEMYSTMLEYNSVGGKCLDYQKYGEILAGMLERVLNGEISVQSDAISHSRWVFDNNMLIRFNIDEKDLPSDAEILNRVESIWKTNPEFAVAMTALIVIGACVIVGLSIFVSRFRRQNLALLKARRHLHTAEEMLAKDIKLREIYNRLEKMLNTSPVAYAMVEDYKTVDVNMYMNRNIGLKEGDDIRNYYVEPERFEDMIARGAELGEVTGELVALKMSDGSRHRFLSNLSTVEYDAKTAFVVWAVDVEENEVQKDIIKASQSSLQRMLDSLPVAVKIVDRETAMIVYANNECLKMFEYGPDDECCGLPIYTLIPEFQSDGAVSRDKISTMIETQESVSLEFEYITSKGNLLDSLIIACKIEYNGRSSVVSIIKDLKEEREYARMLLSVAEKEKEANQIKSRFLAHMSHEIRTPMNAIIGLCEIELHKPLQEETLNVYSKVHKSAQNLLQIINDILDLSKIEADKMELVTEEFELDEVLSAALFMASPRLENKDVELLLKATPDLPRYVMGDRTRLWQMLKNFLDNSAKYTDKGKVLLEASVDHEHSDDSTVYLRFVVKDTGIGMNEVQLQSVFSPYEQFYNEAQRKYTGTGLGMPISKMLCELMGGELHITSKPGLGTAISLLLPFKRSANEGVRNELRMLEGSNILAVDDDSTALEVMQDILVNNRANCVLSSSGEEAIEIIVEQREMGKTFDVILLDYMMDGMNGLETAKRIQASLSVAPKLLMITAYQRELLDKDIQELGISGIIEKPFIPSQFVNRISAALGYDIEPEPEEQLTLFKDVKVLICEDNLLNQEVAVGMLKRFGIDTVLANNGKHALEILAAGEVVDLILMDLQMPLMNGYETAREIRTNRRFDNVPIISLSADAMPEIVEKCLQSGMNDYAAKPIGFKNLHNIFLKWLPKDKRTGDYDSDVDIAALERFGGDREWYERMLREFAVSLPEQWPDFEYALIHLDDTLREVHNLKGVSGNLSEMEIYNCTIELENSLRGSAPEENLYTRLIEACERAKNRILAADIEEDITVEQGSDDEFKGLIDELAVALNDYDPVASADIVELMKRKSWSQAGDSLEQLYQCTLNYEFDEALDILKSLFIISL